MARLADNDRILITGGSGFIGTNLIGLLGDLGPALLNFDGEGPLDPAHARFWKRGDILDPASLSEAFRGFQPTHVVHLAARCDCDENTTVESGYRANTEGTRNVLEAIKATPGIRRVVVTSTQFVFNKNEQVPEHDQDYAPRTVYGQSKIITEKLTREANLACCWTIIRPTNVWGPWHMRHRRQFFRILGAGLYMHPGREKVVRSYAYVGNVVEQIKEILERPESAVGGKTLYVGDAPLDIFDWVNGFSRALRGKDVKVVPRKALFAIARAGDLISKVTGKEFFLTTSRFRSMTYHYLTPMDETFKVLGPVKYPLEDAIRITADWLQKNSRTKFPNRTGGAS